MCNKMHGNNWKHLETNIPSGCAATDIKSFYYESFLRWFNEIRRKKNSPLVIQTFMNYKMELNSSLFFSLVKLSCWFIQSFKRMVCLVALLMFFFSKARSYKKSGISPWKTFFFISLFFLQLYYYSQNSKKIFIFIIQMRWFIKMNNYSFD